MKPDQNRIVVKVGSSSLTNELGKSGLRAGQHSKYGNEVILVSSGAIAVGTHKLRLKNRPTSIRLKQAASVVGQGSVIRLYGKFFGDYGKTIAQILLRAEDIEHAEKKENLIHTFDALLEMGVIPIVNENDAVGSAGVESEQRLFRDNDMLSANVAILCRAQELVLLSDIDGLYDSDPRLHPNAQKSTASSALMTASMRMRAEPVRAVVRAV